MSEFGNFGAFLVTSLKSGDLNANRIVQRFPTLIRMVPLGKVSRVLFENNYHLVTNRLPLDATVDDIHWIWITDQQVKGGATSLRFSNETEQDEWRYRRVWLNTIKSAWEDIKLNCLSILFPGHHSGREFRTRRQLCNRFDYKSKVERLYELPQNKLAVNDNTVGRVLVEVTGSWPKRGTFSTSNNGSIDVRFQLSFLEIIKKREWDLETCCSTRSLDWKRS